MGDIAEILEDQQMESCISCHQEALRHCQKHGSITSAPDFRAFNTAKIKNFRTHYCNALDNVATALRRQYKQSRNLDNLLIAKSLHTHALNLLQMNNPYLAELLDGLALDLLLIYERTNDLDPLSEAIAAWRVALTLPSLSEDFRADYLVNLAGVLRERFRRTHDQADIKEAMDHYQQALSTIAPTSERYVLVRSQIECLQEEYQTNAPGMLEPGESADIAKELSDLMAAAQSQYDQGHYSEASGLWQQTLTLAQPYMGSDHPLLEKVYNNLGAAELKQGHYQQALEHFEKALQVLRGGTAEAQPSVATALNNIGALYLEMGNYEEAQRALEQALNLWSQHPQWTPNQASVSLVSLGNVYFHQGNYSEAENLLNQALTTWEQDSSTQPQELGHCMADLASLYMARGEYGKAEPLYRKALECTRRMSGEQHPDFAAILNSLGLLYARWGEGERAVETLERGLKIRQSILGLFHPDTANSLNSLGTVMQQLGRLQEGRERLQQALFARQNASTKDWPAIARTLNNLSFNYQVAGEYDEATKLLEQSLELRRQAFGLKHIEVYRCLANLGFLHIHQGHYAAGEPLLREALQGYKDSGIAYHPDLVEGFAELAGVLAVTNRPREALQLLEEVQAMKNKLLGEVFSVGSEPQRMAFLDRVREIMSIGLSLVWRYFSDDPAAIQLAMDWIIRYKGLGLEALVTQREALLSRRYQHLSSRIEEMSTVRMQIAQANLASFRLDNPVDQPQIEQWRENLRDLEAELASQIPEMNMVQRLKQVNHATIAASLPDKTVLIEFVSFEPFNFGAKPANGDPLFLPSRYLAFTLQANNLQSLRMIDLGEAKAIEDLLHDFRNILNGETSQRRDLGPQQDPAPTLRQASSIQLRQKLFDPLKVNLDGISRLFISPDGELNLIPFEVLSQDDGTYLIDDYVISYLATGRDLLRWSSGQRRNPRPPLVMADPDFNLCAAEGQAIGESLPSPRDSHPSRALYQGNLYFQDLAHVRQEAEFVTRRLGAKALLGQNALEATLKAYGSPQVLHLATHGFFLEDQAWLTTTQGEAPLMGEDSPISQSSLENPLLRSGLALAGANTFLQGGALPPAAEDGLLTAEDVSVMNLGDTELVVLSACETGLGHISVGEGVFGLRRAFELAGAKTLIMSLWRVPDQQTRLLMEEFYQLILNGYACVEALREAQLRIKAKYPDPLNWGAFICQGRPGKIALS